MNDLRQKLLDTAPEGVDYVYWENNPTLMFTYDVFWHHTKNGWSKSHSGAGWFSRGNFEEIWKGKEEGVKNKMRQEKGGLWVNYSHNYLDWIRHGEEQPFSSDITDLWRKRAEGFLDPMMEAWYPKLYAQTGMR